MSAIIQLKNSSESNYKKVKKAVAKAGFTIVGDSAKYLVVARFSQQSNFGDAEEVVDKLTKLDPPYKNTLIPPNKQLKDFPDDIIRSTTKFASSTSFIAL